MKLKDAQKLRAGDVVVVKATGKTTQVVCALPVTPRLHHVLCEDGNTYCHIDIKGKD